MLILGWGLLAIRPRLMIGSAVALQTAPLPSLGLGCVALVGQFIVLTILFAFAILMWIVARPLGGAVGAAAFVVLLLIILLVILSAIPVAMAIGGLVLRGDRSPYLVYLAGAAILSLAILIAGFVPALGGLVFLIVWILGLGAYTLYLWRTQPTLPAASCDGCGRTGPQRLKAVVLRPPAAPGTRRTPHAAGRTSPRWWRRHRRPRRSPA